MDDEICDQDAGSLAESQQYTPPISSLPADVLLQIFRINADLDEDGPLNIQQTNGLDTHRAINATRLSSQVSSLWRDLIVNASILWANLIDLDFLNRAHSQWREIVMSRAQNSPLHVKGFLSLPDLGFSGNDSEEPWWLDFLNSSWPRIRKLDLDIESGFSGDSLTGDQAALYRKGLSFLSRSTSALQYFYITMQNRWGPSENGYALFDNYAPQLRHFEVMNLHFDHDSPWLSQLHAFHIHEHRGEQFSSVDELYQVLSRMEQLESLNLNTFSTDPYIAPHRARLHFPRLKYLQFKTLGYSFDDDSEDEDESQPTRPACWPLLNCINPAPGCSVRVIIPDLSPSDVTESHALSRLAENHVQVHQPRYLSVTSHPNWFAFTVDKNFLSEELKSTEPFFTLLLEFDTNMAFAESDMRIYLIFKAMCSLSYPSVVELDISVSAEHLRSEDDEFVGFLSSFIALKKLVTDAHTLSRLCLSRSQVVEVHTLFPVLDVLEITATRTISTWNALLPLLLRRERPVSTLLYHAQAEGNFCTVDNLSALESFNGLNVVRKVTGTCPIDGEYTCGSGTPKALNIKTEWERVRDSKEPSELRLTDLLGNGN